MRIVILKKKNMPITTSQIPITINQISGEPKGRHITDAFSRPTAGESPRGFHIPN